jgi:hypothetical protein
MALLRRLDEADRALLSVIDRHGASRRWMRPPTLALLAVAGFASAQLLEAWRQDLWVVLVAVALKVASLALFVLLALSLVRHQRR